MDLRRPGNGARRRRTIIRMLSSTCVLMMCVTGLAESTAHAAGSALSVAVSGNHLVNAAGLTVQLHGVNRSGT